MNNPVIKTAVKPFTVPVINKPIVTPTLPAPATAKSPPIAKVTATKPPKRVPSKVAVYLSIESDPVKSGLGAAWILDTKDMGRGRAIAISLFRERLLVSRSLSKGDNLLLRFLASLTFAEFLISSRVSRTWEIADILDGVIKHLGGPWPFRANFTFLACELAKSDLTAGIDKVFEAKAPIHWFTLECELTPEASFWQWNPAISKPQKKGNKTETP